MPKTSNEDFLLPQPHEKLTAKFILDALEKKKKAAHQELTSDLEMEAAPEVASEPKSSTVTEAAPRTEKRAPTLGEVALDKKYFRIGEAADLLGVEPYVLRYWEGEFAGIRPMKTKSGHRTYSRKDMEKFLEIRRLLYVEKFSVKGARKHLARQKKEPTPVADLKTAERQKDSIKHVIHELKGLIQLARGNPGL